MILVSQKVEVSISINPVNDAPVSEDVDTITTTGSTLSTLHQKM